MRRCKLRRRRYWRVLQSLLRRILWYLVESGEAARARKPLVRFELGLAPVERRRASSEESHFKVNFSSLGAVKRQWNPVIKFP